MNWIIDNMDQILNITDSALTLALLVAALTPTKSDDTVVGRAANIFGQVKGILPLVLRRK